ncbi:carbonic anhydrase-related protein 10-like [Astyanax mexicanus]|uniref:Carbonic anhydrase-related protein 10-like n=1 Tax=Astyanax mexicanus TaxID=7994 RepID=A0A8T2KWS5_ASTMX|nr:carbonic anhydrase-related protein 10-like [Astyanax mexicanus]
MGSNSRLDKTHLPHRRPPRPPPAAFCCRSAALGWTERTMQLLCEIFLILHITIISSEAQPVSSKLHDGWWAYKDAVQGTFIPGKREWVRGKVIELCVKQGLCQL